MAEQAWEEIIKTQDSAQLTPEEKEAKVEAIAKWVQKAKTWFEKNKEEEAYGQSFAQLDLDRWYGDIYPGWTDNRLGPPPEKVAEAAAAKKELEQVTADPGKPNIDIKKEIYKIVETLWALFPFLKKFFDSYLKKTEPWDNNAIKPELDKVKDQKQLEILKKYWIKTEILQNKDTKITPPEGAKVTWTKSPKPAEWQKDPAKPIPLQLKKEGPIVLSAENSESIEIKDNTNGCTITVKNKDGSTDTYVIVSDKKPDAPKEWTKQA